MSQASYRALAREVSELRRMLESRQTPQLGFSSMHDGSIGEYDAFDQLVARYGKQHDGTRGAVVLAGPVPPTPAGVTAIPAPAGVLVVWDGSFVPLPPPEPDQAPTPQVAPMDFLLAEVHASTDPDFTGLLFDTKAGEIVSARGGSFVVPCAPDVQIYIRVVVRATSGKASTPSGAVGPVAGGKMPGSYVEIDYDALGGNKIFRGPDAPPGPHAIGDLWLSEPDNIAHRWEGDPADWVEARDQGVAQAIEAAFAAQETADRKTTTYQQADEPDAPATGFTVGDEWFDDDRDNLRLLWTGTDWTPVPIGNQAIEPNSLVARDVIATGTISAALFEAIIVLATTIIAGDPAGTHARMTPTGFRVFLEDPIDLIPNEVIRLGTDTNDYFGIVDQSGTLVLSLDDSGSVNGRAGNFRDELTVRGRTIASMIEHGASHWYGYHPDAAQLGLSSEIGLIEVAVDPTPGHMYQIIPEVFWARFGADGAMILRVREATAGQTLDINSPFIYERPFSIASEGIGSMATSPALWSWPTAGTRRLLLTAARQGAGVGNIDVYGSYPPSLTLLDLGPARPIAASVNRGGGTTVQPRRQYDTGDMGPASWAAWRGNGTLRNDVPGPVQGWDPSGFNGDGRGHWRWNMPNITGTVDRVDVYLYAEHWNNNSGGTAIINALRAGEGGPSYGKYKGDLFVPGFTKPGGKWVTLPADWNQYFSAAGVGGVRFDGVTVGPSGGTNLTYYGRFQGSAARMRVWYTQ